ncbi:hypothetical protein CE91St45_24450 [Oscillospiraceae bacterium]|nr:hypothetical protein CE91St45_24450 [Oscillospiraceae bacterium]
MILAAHGRQFPSTPRRPQRGKLKRIPPGGRRRDTPPAARQTQNHPRGGTRKLKEAAARKGGRFFSLTGRARGETPRDA